MTIPAIPAAPEPGRTTLPAEAEFVIIGAGFSGITSAIQLSRRGHTDIVVIERQSDLGGTWHSNRYPGVQCDVPSHLYSFSFARNPDWSKLFADGEEIWQYQKKVVSDEGLDSVFHFNTEAQEIRWLEEERQWRVTTDNGVIHGTFLLLCTGHLADHRLPDVTGIDTFPGPAFHSNRWQDVDLQGKRVGVVGTGATAVQLVPSIVDEVGELVVFQRTPGWVLPRAEHEFTETEKAYFRRNPEALDELRREIFQQRENHYANMRGVEPWASGTKKMALDHLAEQVEDPELRAKLTPDFEPGCKRLLLSNRWYPALQKENVTVEFSALKHVDGSTVTAESGEQYELDVLLFATGFTVAEPPYSQIVVGEGGVLMADAWSEGMKAMDSVAIAGFPNMFTVNGPNGALGHNSIIYMLESEVSYIVDAVEWVKEQGGGVLQAKADKQDEYLDWITEVSQDSVVLTGGCSSWYLDPRSGKQAVVWPESAADFRATNYFRPERFDFTPARRPAGVPA